MSTDTELRAATRDLLGYYGMAGGTKPGGFTSALISAFDKADVSNTARLAQAFPAMARAMSAMKEEHGLHDIVPSPEVAL